MSLNLKTFTLGHQGSLNSGCYGLLLNLSISLVVVGLLPSRETIAASGWVSSGRCTSSYDCVGRCGSDSLCRTGGRCGMLLPGLWSKNLLRAALFSFRWSVRSCSACLVPQCTAALQESLDSARLSHDWMSIDALFRSLLQVSGTPRKFKLWLLWAIT